MNKTDLDTAQIIANLRDTARLQHGDRPGSIMHLAADCISQQQTWLNEARAEVERLKRELEQAIAERTPHDCGILRNQRDDCRDRLCSALKEAQDARTVVEQLKQALHDARLENSAQAAQLEQCREEYRAAHLDRQHYKRIAEHRQKELSGLLARPEPSRLEIAAMLFAGWLSNPDVLSEANPYEARLLAADKLIAAAKGGAK
jgi:flagellar biosynthesis chaperone FliJ